MLSRDNPMRMPLMSVLIFEVIVMGLTIPGMIQVEDLSWQVAVTVGGVGVIVAVAAAALLSRGPAGYVLGWVTQVVIVAMGVFVPMMYFVGGVFAMIWTMSIVMGRRLEPGSRQ